MKYLSISLLLTCQTGISDGRGGGRVVKEEDLHNLPATLALLPLFPPPPLYPQEPQDKGYRMVNSRLCAWFQDSRPRLTKNWRLRDAKSPENETSRLVQTLLRYRDWGKIFRDSRFSRNHSIPPGELAHRLAVSVSAMTAMALWGSVWSFGLNKRLGIQHVLHC